MRSLSPWLSTFRSLDDDIPADVAEQRYQRERDIMEKTMHVSFTNLPGMKYEPSQADITRTNVFATAAVKRSQLWKSTRSQRKEQMTARNRDVVSAVRRRFPELFAEEEDAQKAEQRRKWLAAQTGKLVLEYWALARKVCFQ